MDPGLRQPYLPIVASAPEPSTSLTLKAPTSLQAAVLRPCTPSDRAHAPGGPAVRLPSESYWPPWHGQPNPPAGNTGVYVTFR